MNLQVEQQQHSSETLWIVTCFAFRIDHIRGVSSQDKNGTDAVRGVLFVAFQINPVHGEKVNSTDRAETTHMHGGFGECFLLSVSGRDHGT